MTLATRERRLLISGVKSPLFVTVDPRSVKENTNFTSSPSMCRGGDALPPIFMSFVLAQLTLSPSLLASSW